MHLIVRGKQKDAHFCVFCRYVDRFNFNFCLYSSASSVRTHSRCTRIENKSKVHTQWRMKVIFLSPPFVCHCCVFARATLYPGFVSRTRMIHVAISIYVYTLLLRPVESYANNAGLIITGVQCALCTQSEQRTSHVISMKRNDSELEHLNASIYFVFAIFFCGLSSFLVHWVILLYFCWNSFSTLLICFSSHLHTVRTCSMETNGTFCT